MVGRHYADYSLSTAVFFFSYFKTDRQLLELMTIFRKVH